MSALPITSVSSVTVVKGSGTNVTTITSGLTGLLDVMPYLLSGQGGVTSFSGQVLGVFDAVSGIANPDISGSKILYRFDFGTHSGVVAGTGTPAGIPIQMHASDQITALSGLVAVGISGWALTVVFTK